MQKINSWNSRTTERNSTFVPDASSADSLLFRNPNSPNDAFGRAAASQEEMRALASNASVQNYETLSQQGSKMRKMGSTLSQAQEHIIAERKRREILNQRFIALSAAIPGLKKKDKNSILGDAVKYVKELEARVKTLEEQNAKRTVESVVFVKKSKLSADADGSSSNGCSAEKPLPEIEAMLSKKAVLIRIHCDNHRGVLARLKDKNSILGDAVKYVKELEARVKTLEEQNAKRTVESVVFVKKSKLSADADGSSSNGCSAEKPLPEIEAMLSKKAVLIRIHCDNHRGVLARLVSEIEKAHLTVTNASVMPFPSSSIHITLTAKASS
ncbi:hypothetical protein COCNU_scaffold000517G000010 [Cocos nucifera]|nr:hypothetical protein [Cocos nucifera]